MVVVCVVKTRSRSFFVFDQLQCAGVVWAWAAGPCASSCKTRRCNVLNTSPYLNRSPIPSRRLMAKNYRRLWKDVTSARNEGEAVRTLAGIVLDKEGRAFISGLGPDDAKLCIEILDHVSCGSCLLPAFPVSDGFIRASQSTNSKPQRDTLSLSC